MIEVKTATGRDPRTGEEHTLKFDRIILDGHLVVGIWVHGSNRIEWLYKNTSLPQSARFRAIAIVKERKRDYDLRRERSVLQSART